MRFTEGCAPVPSPDRQNAELGNNDGSPDGSGDFFRRLDSQPDVAFGVTDNDDSLESGTLTSAGLLLYGFDLVHEDDQFRSSAQEANNQ